MENAEKECKYDKTPGSRVKFFRKAKSMDQKTLASAIMCSENLISMIERGRRSLTSENAKALEGVLGVRAEFLLRFDDFPTDADRWEHEFKEIDKEGEMWETFLRVIAMKAGYSLKIKQFSKAKRWGLEDQFCFVDEHGKEIGFSFFDRIKNGVAEEGIESLKCEIFDYAAYRLKRMIDKKDNRISIDFRDDNSKGDCNNG